MNMWRANAGSRQAMSRTEAAARSFVVPSNSACASSACARHNAPPATAPASTIGPNRSWRRRSPSRTPAVAHSPTSTAPTIWVGVGPSSPPDTASPAIASPTATGAARKHQAGFNSACTAATVERVPVRAAAGASAAATRFIGSSGLDSDLCGKGVTFAASGVPASPFRLPVRSSTCSVTRPAGRFRANVVGRSRRGRRRARTLTS